MSLFQQQRTAFLSVEQHFKDATNIKSLEVQMEFSTAKFLINLLFYTKKKINIDSTSYSVRQET